MIRTSILKINLKLLLTTSLVVAIAGAAVSSTFNSGKTKKKHAVKSALSFNTGNKSLNMSIANGFYLRGFSHFTTHLKSDPVFNVHSLYFQKGNSIYVLPVKHKIMLSRFKTPQKAIY